MQQATALAESAPAPTGAIRLISMITVSRMGANAQATITLDIDGKHETAQELGVGPVDAIYRAMKKLVPHEAEFRISRVENEKESVGSAGLAHVRAEFWIHGDSIIGEGIDPDTLVATATAFVHAINQIRKHEQGTAH